MDERIRWRLLQQQREELGRPRVPEDVEIPPDVALRQNAGAGASGLIGAMREPDPAGMDRQRIGEKEIAEAAATLTRYKDGKQNLESRVVEDELWWELRHWEAIRREKPKGWSPEPTSAWLFNTLMNKHADAMDNMPEPVILPREQSDEESAKMLCSVVPVVMEYNDYDRTISDAWWEKLKHGTACYFVGWNPKKENGMGDIDVRQLDLLNVFWEPGVTDIQKSRNLFIVDLVDEDLLDQQYPQYKGRLGGKTIDVKKYCYDETIDLSKKSLVVDWYYKIEDPIGKTVLHYAKFVGNVLLYASENDPELAGRGFYDHGMYPVVMDTLFPEKGMPVGFGYIAVCKDPQMYIDKLYGHILDHAMKATKPRSWVSNSTAVNEEEFLDWEQPLVHVEGEIDDRRIKDIVVQPISSIYVEIAQMKIDEMKETAANRDANSGGSSAGVTAAAAIAALQEAGNKVSRDMISAHYRAFADVVELVIELMRQFYDEKRAFRVTAPNQQGYEFVQMDNSGLRDQPMPQMYPGQTEMLYRRPVFDVKVKAQKKSPFSRMEQNERAKELFNMGFFNPELAQQAMGALQMMDFEGIDDVKQYVEKGQTLQNLVQQLTLALQQSQGMMGMPMDGTQQGEAQAPQSGKSMDSMVVDAEKPNMTAYGQRLAARSTPNMDLGSSAATPGGGA